MKIKPSLIFLIYTTLAFEGCNCKKSVPTPISTLPPITHVGANTFGCKINGQVWVPYYPCVNVVNVTELQYNITPIYNYSVLPLFLSLETGKFAPSESSEFLFQQNGSLSDHIYSLGNIYDSLSINYLGKPGNIYYNYSAQAGDTSSRYFQITKLDTVNKIISGVFAFTLYNGPPRSFGTDSIVVTDGRFDIKIGHYIKCSN